MELIVGSVQNSAFNTPYDSKSSTINNNNNADAAHIAM